MDPEIIEEQFVLLLLMIDVVEFTGQQFVICSDLQWAHQEAKPNLSVRCIAKRHHWQDKNCSLIHGLIFLNPYRVHDFLDIKFKVKTRAIPNIPLDSLTHLGQTSEVT